MNYNGTLRVFLTPSRKETPKRSTRNLGNSTSKGERSDGNQDKITVRATVLKKKRGQGKLSHLSGAVPNSRQPRRLGGVGEVFSHWGKKKHPNGVRRVKLLKKEGGAEGIKTFTRQGEKGGLVAACSKEKTPEIVWGEVCSK